MTTQDVFTLALPWLVALGCLLLGLAGGILVVRYALRVCVLTVRPAARFDWWEDEHERWAHADLNAWLDYWSAAPFTEDGEWNHERFGPERWVLESDEVTVGR